MTRKGFLFFSLLIPILWLISGICGSLISPWKEWPWFLAWGVGGIGGLALALIPIPLQKLGKGKSTLTLFGPPWLLINFTLIPLILRFLRHGKAPGLLQLFSLGIILGSLFLCVALLASRPKWTNQLYDATRPAALAPLFMMLSGLLWLFFFLGRISSTALPTSFYVWVLGGIGGLFLTGMGLLREKLVGGWWCAGAWFLGTLGLFVSPLPVTPPWAGIAGGILAAGALVWACFSSLLDKDHLTKVALPSLLAAMLALTGTALSFVWGDISGLPFQNLFHPTDWMVASVGLMALVTIYSFLPQWLELRLTNPWPGWMASLSFLLFPLLVLPWAKAIALGIGTLVLGVALFSQWNAWKGAST